MVTFLCSIRTNKFCVPSNYIIFDEVQNRKHWLSNSSSNQNIGLVAPCIYNLNKRIDHLTLNHANINFKVRNPRIYEQGDTAFAAYTYP